MITLADVRDWLKTFNIGEHFYIGKLDNKKDKSIGVYDRQQSGGANIALGGTDCTKTEKISVMIVVGNSLFSYSYVRRKKCLAI